MSEPDSQRYDILFAGECLPGHDPAQVHTAIGKLFKADAATLQRLFSGSRQRIKRGCDHETALKYQRAMKAAGAKPIITRTTDAPVASEQGTPGEASATPAADSPQHPDQAGTPAVVGLTLAPSGSDVLRPDERGANPPREIDLSHLSLAAVDAPLAESSTADTPIVSAPDFELAEVGSVLSAGDTTEPVAAPLDTSALSLAPEGHDFSDCHPPVPVRDDLSTEHLQLADAGGELLDESERQIDDTPAPDISHITLQDSANDTPSGTVDTKP